MGDQNNTTDNNILFQQAITLYHNGNQADSLKLLNILLKSSPKHAEGNHLLGLIEAQRGSYYLAAKRITQAIEQRPDIAEYHYNLGNVLQIGGQPEKALASYKNTLKLNPQNIEARFNLGILLRELGHKEEAIAAFKQLIKCQPCMPEAYFEHGNSLQEAGKLEAALTSYRQAISINPKYSEAYYNIGILLRNSGKTEQALAALNQAIQYMPDFANAYFERGNVHMDSGQIGKALESFTLAINFDPELAEARSNRGRALFESGRINEALLAYNRAIEQKPNLAEAHCGLGNVLMCIGRPEEAERSFRHAIEINPHYSPAHSNLLFLLSAQATLSPEGIMKEQRQWDAVHGQEGKDNQFPPRPFEEYLSRRLRIGYVSADLYKHSASYFFEPLLAAHDRNHFEIFCYNTNPKKADSTTERLRGITEHWRLIANENDRELAERIYKDGIDILIDMTGHLSGSRLKAFTYRPAPIQAAYLGYIAATGLESMDYWITDSVLHPNNTQEKTVETIYRLPRCAFCYLPPSYTPEVSPCPSKGGGVTFGSFSNLSKITPELLRTWSKLLLNLPESCLMIMDKPLLDRSIREELVKKFAHHGISSERLLIRKGASHLEYLKSYSEIDIVLDTFPRTGGTTTAEALWMGVPVVTLAGQRYAGRISASKLAALGLKELISFDSDEYIEKAIFLAQHPDKLLELRNNLRAIFSQSSLYDGNGLARAMEKAYMDMWRNRVAQG